MITLPKIYDLDQGQLSKVTEAGNIFIHTPDKAAQEYISYVEDFQTSRKVTWGCKTVDEKITPMAPGQTTVLVARPGSGKTSTLIYMARREALRCDIQKGECVIYVSWEEPVESIEMSIQSGDNYTSEEIAFGRVDMGLVRKGALSRANLPLIVIGYSMTQMAQNIGKKKRPPPLYVERVLDSILSIYFDFGLKPTLICGDYVQKIPIDFQKYRDRTAGISEAMYQISELGMQTSCPILLGAQAVRSVDNQGIPMPTLSGAQWTSAIEQEAFRMMGLYRPITSLGLGEEKDFIEINQIQWPVTKDLLLMALLKQRQFYPQNNLMTVHFNPATFQMFDLDPITKKPFATADNAAGQRVVKNGFAIKEQI